MNPIVDALCRMPIRIWERGDISMIGLLKESGYWYLAQPETGLDGTQGWRVGYYADDDRRLPEKPFPDEFAACTFYIARVVETLS